MRDKYERSVVFQYLKNILERKHIDNRLIQTTLKNMTEQSFEWEIFSPDEINNFSDDLVYSYRGGERALSNEKLMSYNKKAKTILSRNLKQMKTGYPSPIQKNLNTLSCELGLDKLESEILGFYLRLKLYKFWLICKLSG